MVNNKIMTTKELDALRNQLTIMLHAVKAHGNAIEDGMRSLNDMQALQWARSLQDALADAVEASK